ncbi:MAG TPA: UbiA family prenyltransferase, partial [Polyangiaceae bacterium]
MSTALGFSVPARDDALGAIRLREWVHFLLLPLASLGSGRSLGGELVSVLRGAGIAFCLLAFGYLLNALADREMDGDSRRALPNEAARLRSVARLPPVFAVLALVLAATAPWPVWIATVVCVASGWAYSTGPRLKARPLLGSALNVTNFVPLLFLGLSSDALPLGMLALAGVFGCLLLQNQLLHEAADVEADRRGRVHTTFLLLGPKGSACLALLLGVAAAVPSLRLALDTAGPAAIGVTVLVLPSLVLFPIWLGRRGADSQSMARARALHRGASLLLGAAL